jgi:hypothetical protein
MDFDAVIDAYWVHYRRTSGGATRSERVGADEFEAGARA